MQIYHNVKYILILIAFFILLTDGSLYTKITVKATEIKYPFSTSDDVIQKAIDFLKKNQKEDGSIGGFSISAWAAMAVSAANESLDKWRNLTLYLEEHISLLQDNKITDWERMVLAAVSLDKDPRDFNGINLVKRVKDSYDGEQIGDSSNIYDDIFGIIALISAGVNKNDTIIKKTVEYIKEKQHEDGGWGDVDTTAAAVMALKASGDNSYHIEKALSYIKTKQQDNGGFISWGTTNIATTSWAVDAIVAAGDDPTSREWEKNGKTPIDFILSLQKDNGSFSWSEDKYYNPEWMTSYAIPALLGKTYPIKKLQPQRDNDEDHEDKGEDESEINNSNNKDEDNSRVISYFITPEDNSIYIFDIKIRTHLLNTIVIGPLTIKVDVPSEVNKTVFIVDGREVYTDYTKPFTYTLNTWSFFSRKIITVKEYFYKNNSSYNLIYSYIENISSLSKKIYNPIIIGRIKENISKIEDLCLIRDPIIIEKEIVYINLFPNLYRRLIL